MIASPAVVPVDATPSNPSPDAPKGGAGDWARALREAAPYLGLGTSLAVTVLAGLGAGYWIDGRVGTKPIFFLVGGGFGLVTAGFQFVGSVMGRKR
jgi:F0F1-type ATP synthase assembly protein I